MQGDASPTLRNRLHAGDLLVGNFFKTPSHCVVEVLCFRGLDFVVIDAEHAPIDLNALDAMIMTSRAGRLPAIVRVARNEPTTINSYLDIGADGALVPHVRSASDAASALAACRYSSGLRGFSPSSRAGDYGTTPAYLQLHTTDQRVDCWCQIEDAQAVEDIDAVSSVPGLDCLFVGRQDLALSMGVEDINHVNVRRAVGRVAIAGRAKGVHLVIFVSDSDEIPELHAIGFRAFVCGSDQSMLMSHACQVARRAHSA